MHLWEIHRSIPVPLRLGQGNRCITFDTPREINIKKIKDIVTRFAEAVKLTSETGFGGVENRAAHDYFLHTVLKP
jgi:2,4-dienoyl-CoA reductase-like NADH-dependent reductase (Old Yellow Enzyme family)